MKKGTVNWFDSTKGFGFIKPEEGNKDLFVHHSDIQGNGDRVSLSNGQSVEFEIGQGPKGDCAKNVRPL